MTISETQVITFLSGKRMQKIGRVKPRPGSHTVHIYQTEDPRKGFVYTASVENCYLELNVRASGEREGVDLGIDFSKLGSWIELEFGLRRLFGEKKKKNPYDAPLLQAYENFLFAKQAL